MTDALGLAESVLPDHTFPSQDQYAAFVASIRIGILVGRRLDGLLEARDAAGTVEEGTMPVAPESADENPQPMGNSGREEYRGE